MAGVDGLEDAMIKPRVLMMAPRLPEYDRESGSRRVYHFVELFLDSGYDVTFVAENTHEGERYIRQLQQRGVLVYGNSTFNNPAVLMRMVRYDLVLLTFWNTAHRLLPLIRPLALDIPIIVDSVDLHFLRQARSLLTENGALSADFATNATNELNVYAQCDLVLTVSQKETDLVNDFFFGQNKALAVGDFEDFPLSPVALSQRKGILFIGNFRHPPNVEALAYLFEQIAPRISPRILAQHPLQIVGNALDGHAAKYANKVPNVKMIGWVPAVEPYLNHARVNLVPLRNGAGTKRKLIQALMIGTPTVSTSVGAEGLNLDDGVNILCADQPDEFAAKLETLIDDDALWTLLARNGRKHILETHARDVVKAQFQQALARFI